MNPKEILDILSTAGALGFMTIAVWALATGRVVPVDMLNYERQQKDQAIEIARAALASHDKLADAVEERNRLDRERLSVRQ